jgi:hypothetical protein
MVMALLREKLDREAKTPGTGVLAEADHSADPVEISAALRKSMKKKGWERRGGT